MTERSVFKNKISLLNCSSEADETLSPLFLLKIKSCVSDGCHYLSWFWASLLEMFFLHWNVCSVQPGSLSLHALCHMHRYSGRCGRVLHQQNLVARVRWQPSDARFEGSMMPGSMNQHGGERTHSSVCWSQTLEILWCFITVFLSLSNKILLPFTFLWQLFFSLFTTGEKKVSL